MVGHCMVAQKRPGLNISEIQQDDMIKREPTQNFLPRQAIKSSFLE